MMEGPQCRFRREARARERHQHPVVDGLKVLDPKRPIREADMERTFREVREGAICCRVHCSDGIYSGGRFVRSAAPLTVLSGSRRRWNPLRIREFCPHVDSGRTSEGTSTGELLSTLRATDEIHQVDPETWAVPPGASGFHLPGVRGGRDQRGRAGYIGRFGSRPHRLRRCWAIFYCR